MNRILAFFFLWISCTAGGQNTSVSGTALGQPNQLVRVLVYADQFSLLDSTLATTETDVWGNFTMSFSLRKTEYAFLALGLNKGEFYMEPGNAYRAFIRADTVQGSVFDQLPLQFELEEEGELNKLIGEFNFDYNTFILQYQKQLLRAKPEKLIDDFINTETLKFAEMLEQSTYFSNYFRYSLASLQWITHVKNDTTVIKEFFTGKEVLYENIAYTSFFRDFFKQYVKTRKVYDYPQLLAALNTGKRSYVDSLLRQDQWLDADARVRELVLMLLAARNYYNDPAGKEKKIDIFTELEQTGKYDSNRRIAGNFKKKLRKLDSGTKAPSFKLKDVAAGASVDLDDFKGKFVLLDFITSGCKPCLYDFSKLREIQEAFGPLLEVVVITAGNGIDEAVSFNEGGHFRLLDMGGQILLLEDYEIKTYPTYIILYPDGTVAMAPAPLPHENLDVFLDRFRKRYEQSSGKTK